MVELLGCFGVRFMDSDRILGAGIVIGVIIAAIAYFGFIMLGYGQQVVLVVVSIAFLAVLVVGGWIGWTMASTPTPEEVEDVDFEEMEDFDEEIEEPEEIAGPEAESEDAG